MNFTEAIEVLKKGSPDRVVKEEAFEASKEPRSKLRGILEDKPKLTEKSKQASRNSTQEIKSYRDWSFWTFLARSR
jgi:hypothetical protein